MKSHRNEVRRSLDRIVPMQEFNISRFATVILILFSVSTLPLKAGTDFRVGAAIPISSIVFSNVDAYNIGVGFEALMDFQTSRDASTYVSFGYSGAGGKTFTTGVVGDITNTPSFSDYLINVGYSYYPLRRKVGVTPILSIETGLHFVQEKINYVDSYVDTTYTEKNNLLFQSISLSLGVEIPLDDRLSIDPRVRLNLNFPVTPATYGSYLFSNEALNYIQAQFLLCAEYRLGK